MYRGTVPVVVHSIGFFLIFTALKTAWGASQRAITGYKIEQQNTTNPYDGVDAYKWF